MASIPMPPEQDEDGAFERTVQNDLDSLLFGKVTQPKPHLTKCQCCGFVAAQVICSLCGTERLFYTRMKVALAAGRSVDDSNAGEVLRSLKGEL